MNRKSAPLWILSLLLAFFVVGERPAGAQSAQVTATPSPAPGSIIVELIQINVVFSESVVGVDASDLLVNGVPASGVVTNNPNDYSFTVVQPADGAVEVTWADGHGIVANSALATPFVGGMWTYVLDTNFAFSANFILSEIMASNNTGILDDDGNHSDWIEILNPGPQQASLDGWYLTDTESNPTKWRFPFPMPPLQPNSYLLVWGPRPRTEPMLSRPFTPTSSFRPVAAISPWSARAPMLFPPLRHSRRRLRMSPSAATASMHPSRAISPTPPPGRRTRSPGPGFVADPVVSIPSGVYTNDTLLLSITAPAGTIRYTLNGSLPLTNSTLYTNAITISNSTAIKVRVFPPAGTNLFPSSVVSRNIIFLDNTTRDFSSELPLVVISTQGQAVASDVAPGGKRTEGTLALIDTFQGRSTLQSTPDFIGNVGVEIFGQTSAGFAKQPYRIEVHDELGNDLSIPVFGLPAESDWKMRNPFDDKSLMNDYLAYEIFEKMGHYSCRRRLVEVFVDSGGGRLKYPADYVGVEALFESIKQGGNRVNIAKIPPTATTEPAITGGFVFAKDKDSPGDLNFSTAGGGGFPGQTLKMHEPKPNEMRPTPLASKLTPAGSNQLNYIVKYLNRMERAMYTNTWLAQTGTNHYSSYLDVDSFIDFHWTVEFPKQIDGVRLSTYFTKDRGGKLQAGPVWDWNLSFGNADYLRGGQTNGWYYSEQDQGITANEHIWLRRLINGNANMGGSLPDGSGNAANGTGDPDFNQKVSDRWSVLRTNILNATNLSARIDELSTMLSGAAARDLWGKYRSQVVGVDVWPNPDGTGDGRDVNYAYVTNYTGGTADSIIGQMKKFVLGRYLWIDSQFTHQPSISAAGGAVSSGYTFTVTPPAGTMLYYTLDGTDPRSPGGAVASGVISNTSAATITVNSNTRVFARAFQSGSWYGTWSGPSVASFLIDTPPVRITEVLYHPAAPPVGNTNVSSDFEFIEVKNGGTKAVSLARYSLGGGVTFTFPDLTLQPGGRAVVVANTAAFRSLHPEVGIIVAGEYTGSLNNSGDRITLVGPMQEPIQDISFSPAWYPATDGTGFALVAVNEDASGSASGQQSAWRPGSILGGTPGAGEPAATPFPAVVVNEVLNHSVAPAVDQIELLNRGGQPADISGWYLTDNLKSPKKFLIPAGTVIPAGGYKVYTEADFNAGASPFSLSSLGEEVYLFSADSAGNLTGYAHGFTFGAQVEAASFGRHLTSDGREHFVTQKAVSFGSANPGPKVGPVVISEIHYHPQDVSKYGSLYDDSFGEFIELRNITSSNVPLFDPAFPTNTWALKKAVGFVFPANTSIPSQGAVLVVGFNPSSAVKLAAFRSRYGISAAVPVYGPWSGQLANNGDTVELVMPDQPVAAPSSNAGLVPYVVADSVSYSDAAPWPALADGRGASLHRLVLDAFGDDPANWSASAPSPGSGDSPTAPPTIVQQPSSLTAVMTNTATASFSVTAGGAGAPFSYQWLLNGVTLPGATDSTLIVDSLNPVKAGRYSAVVLNAGGGTLSSEATLTLLQPLTILTQPRPTGGRPGTNVTVSVAALSTTPLRYQWYFNGNAIPGAAAATLQLSNLRLSDDGDYQVLVSDSISSVLSDSVRIAVLVNPNFLVQPVSQSVIRGGSALLSVVISNTATMPLTYRWKKGGAITSTQITNSLVSYLLVTNVQSTVTYGVLVTNLATRTGTNSANAILTVVEDTDKDGIPDEYELLYPAFLNPADASDAALDYDGDGMSNLSEYIAGTDPSDKTSYLKVESIHSGVDGTRLELYARSNRSYTVEFRESVGPGLLADAHQSPGAAAEPGGDDR